MGSPSPRQPQLQPGNRKAPQAHEWQQCLVLRSFISAVNIKLDQTKHLCSRINTVEGFNWPSKKKKKCWNYHDGIDCSIRRQLRQRLRHRTAILGWHSVLEGCLKDAVKVLTKYLPSASVFCHQVNHALCLHDLRKSKRAMWHRRQAGPAEPVILTVTALLKGHKAWGRDRYYCEKGEMGTFTASEAWSCNPISWEAKTLLRIRKSSISTSLTTQESPSHIPPRGRVLGRKLGHQGTARNHTGLDF